MIVPDVDRFVAVTADGTRAFLSGNDEKSLKLNAPLYSRGAKFVVVPLAEALKKYQKATKTFLRVA